MKIKILSFFILVILFVGCAKSGGTLSTNIDGNYKGTFERDGRVSNVEISFSNGEFGGQGVIDKFPAICNGSYTISGNTVTFNNECVWTADFDWTLILSGTWTINSNNSQLNFFKANGDKYTLIKQ